MGDFNSVDNSRTGKVSRPEIESEKGGVSNFDEAKTGSHSKAEQDQKKMSLVGHQISLNANECDLQLKMSNLDRWTRGAPNP